MLEVKALENGLAGFYGTEAYHKLSIIHGNLFCTDGVKWLAQNAEAFWLIDVIASYQPQFSDDEMLQSIQFWKVKRTDTKAAVVTCERDTDDIVITQKIDYCDFPLDEQKIIVAQGEMNGRAIMVCMLPSEY